MPELSAIRCFAARAGLVLGSALLTATGAQAQTAAALAVQHHATIVKDYPRMLAAFNAKNYVLARKMCQQAIAWEPEEATHRYNLACIEAKAGRPDAAFAALDKAVALGYVNAAELAKEPDLQDLHADPRFNLLVAQVTDIQARRMAPPHIIVQPAAPALGGGRLQGLYLAATPDYDSKQAGRQKYATWYFAPEGKVYYNPDQGFADEDLGADPANYGTFSLEDGSMRVVWPTQDPITAALERFGEGFSWNGAFYTPAKPFNSSQELAERKFRFSQPVSEGTVAPAKGYTIRFNADGTYSTASTVIPAMVAGHWKLEGYYLTFADTDGSVSHVVCFPMDKPETPAITPDELYLTGSVYTNAAAQPAARKAPVQATPTRKK